MDAVDCYLNLWTYCESKDRPLELLSIVEDIEDFYGNSDIFERFQRSEESEKAFHRKEMRFTVVRTFGNHHEVES